MTVEENVCEVMVDRGDYLPASTGCLVQRCVPHVVLHINTSTGLQERSENHWVVPKRSRGRLHWAPAPSSYLQQLLHNILVSTVAGQVQGRPPQTVGGPSWRQTGRPRRANRDERITEDFDLHLQLTFREMLCWALSWRSHWIWGRFPTLALKMSWSSGVSSSITTVAQ